jgi:hypothetical protein
MGPSIVLNSFDVSGASAQSLVIFEHPRGFARQPGGAMITAPLIADICNRATQCIRQYATKQRAAGGSSCHGNTSIHDYSRLLEQKLVSVQTQGDSLDRRSVQLRPTVT